MLKLKKPIRNSSKFFLGIFGILSLCMFYETLSYRQHQRNPQDTTIPNFKQLAHGFRQICSPHENTLLEAFGEEAESTTFFYKVSTTWLFQDAVATYSRLIKGLILGCVLAIILGIAMGCYETIEYLFLPPISLFAMIPGSAMAAVFYVVVGFGEIMFTSMIAFGVLPTLTKAIYLSAKHDVHEEQINKASTLGASNMEIIWDVVFKLILPRIVESVRLQIGPAMVFLIAAEMLYAQIGMGYRIRMGEKLINMAVVYNYLIILGITGLIVDQLMLSFRRWLCPWYSRYK